LWLGSGDFLDDVAGHIQHLHDIVIEHAHTPASA
jgi:hypothetical protein